VLYNIIVHQVDHLPRIVSVCQYGVHSVWVIRFRDITCIKRV